MNQDSEIFKNVIHLANLVLDFLDSLFSFLNNSLIEGDLVIQKQDFLSAR